MGTLNPAARLMTVHSVCAGSAFLAGILLHVYWRRWYQRKLAAAAKRHELWNGTIFFPTHPWVRTEHPNSSLSKFEVFLSRAEKSIKICVMTIQGRLATRLLDLLKAKRRDGVRVEVCSGQAPGTIRNVEEVGGYGIDWRYKVHSYSTTFHHKYVIIDDRYVMTGSVNWTNDALENQSENILITSDPRIVPKYVKAFERIWSIHDPENSEAAE